jgi:hypothetical protein
MSRAKRSSERRGRTKAVTALGVAGMLSLGSGACEAAVDPAGDAPKEKAARVITLGEEEISDVSLATFYVFDNENAGVHRPGLQLARARGCAGCGGCAADCGGGGPTCCASCASAGGAATGCG